MQYHRVLALSRFPYFMLAVLSIIHQSAMQTQLTELCWSGGEFGESQATGILYCLNGLVPEVLPLNITSLFIGGNTITSIEANAFEDSSFTSLQKLTIRRTGIQDFPDHVFSSLHNLIEVHLISNPITTIKQHWLSNMTTLHQLVICQTQIRTIESTTFPPLESMRRLNLSGNQIQTIGRGSFRNLQGLEELDLSSNQLMTLNADGIDGLELKLLDVSRNPWTCECELTDFIQWLRTFTSENGNKTLSNSLLTACAKPPNVAGLALWNLSDMCITSTLSNAYYVITTHTTTAESQGTLAGIIVGSMLLFFVLCFLCLWLLWMIFSRKKQVVQPKEKDLECGVADNCNRTQANPNQSNASVFKTTKTTEQLQTENLEKMDAMIMNNISTTSETRKDDCKHPINKEVSQKKLFGYPDENQHIERFSPEPESDSNITLSQDLDEAKEKESGAKTGKKKRKSRRHPNGQTEQKESNKNSMAEHPPSRMDKLCFSQRLPTYYNDSCKDTTSAETPVHSTPASHSSMEDKHPLKLSAHVLQDHRDSDLTAANVKGMSRMSAAKENPFDNITFVPNNKGGESDEARPVEPDQNEIRLSATTFSSEKLTSAEEKTGEGDGNGISEDSASLALSTSRVNLPDNEADTQCEELTREKMPETYAVRTESDSKGEPGACYQAGTEPGIAFNEPYNVQQMNVSDTNLAAADNMAMTNRCGFRGQRQECPLNKEELGLYNCSPSEKQSVRSMNSCESMINCFTSVTEVTDSHTYSFESLCFPETPQQCKEDTGPKRVATTVQNKIRRKRALSEDPLSPINNKVGTQLSYVPSGMKHSFPGNENQTDKLNRLFFLKQRTSSLPPAQFSTGKARRETVTFSSVSDLGRYKKSCSAQAPSDEDLLNDNQYLEMNLLYEVAENKGRRRRGRSCPGPSLPCEKGL